MSTANSNLQRPLYARHGHAPPSSEPLPPTPDPQSTCYTTILGCRGCRERRFGGALRNFESDEDTKRPFASGQVEHTRMLAAKDSPRLPVTATIRAHGAYLGCIRGRLRRHRRGGRQLRDDLAAPAARRQNEFLLLGAYLVLELVDPRGQRVELLLVPSL